MTDREARKELGIHPDDPLGGTSPSEEVMQAAIARWSEDNIARQLRTLQELEDRSLMPKEVKHGTAMPT